MATLGAVEDDDGMMPAQRMDSSSVELEPVYATAPPAAYAAPSSAQMYPSWDALVSGGTSTGVNIQNALRREKNKDPATATDLQRNAAEQGGKIALATSQQVQILESGLTYQGLVAGFMMADEQQHGAGFMDFTSVEMWDFGKPDQKTVYPQGKVLLTNKRLMFVSCQPTFDATFTTEDNPHKGSLRGAHTLTYSADNAVWYYPVPLQNFRSIEMKASVGSIGQATISKKAPDTVGCCNALCFCLTCNAQCVFNCCGNVWQGSSVVSNTTQVTHLPLQLSCSCCVLTQLN